MFLFCALKPVKFEEEKIDKDYRSYVLKKIYNYINVCERILNWFFFSIQDQTKIFKVYCTDTHDYRYIMP